MKKIMKGSIVLLAALLAAGWATPALAQAQADTDWTASRHWVTGFVGGQFFDLGDQFEDFGANFQKELNVGGRYQYNFTPHWGAEGSVRFSPVNAEMLVGPGEEVSVDTWYYNGNVVYNILPAKRFVPYATGGIGGISREVQSGGDTETHVTFNFGGGVLIHSSPRVAFRFDVRDYVYTADSLGEASTVALRLPADFDETIHDLSVDFGVTFTF